MCNAGYTIDGNTGTCSTAGLPCIDSYLFIQTFCLSVFSPTNGHYYQLITTATNWSSALTAAANAQFRGVSGHLATITYASEQSFIFSTVAKGNSVWLDGSSTGVSNTWVFSSGPSAGIQFSSGNKSVAGSYLNWSTGQPGTGGNCLQMSAASSQGTWIAANCSMKTIFYVIEYECTSGYFSTTGCVTPCSSSFISTISSWY